VNVDGGARCKERTPIRVSYLARVEVNDGTPETETYGEYRRSDVNRTV